MVRRVPFVAGGGGGGAGGSYNAGANQSNVAGANTATGLVTIRWVP